MSDLAVTGVQSARVDPKLVFEIAMGVERPMVLFKRYGYTEDQALALTSNELFNRQVESKASELKAQGLIFKVKAALAAEDIMEDVYVGAKDPETPFSQKLDALKFFSKAAGVDAVAATGGPAGGGST